jgi:hypothetical protein
MARTGDGYGWMDGWSLSKVDGCWICDIYWIYYMRRGTPQIKPYSGKRLIYFSAEQNETSFPRQLLLVLLSKVMQTDRGDLNVDMSRLGGTYSSDDDTDGTVLVTD